MTGDLQAVMTFDSRTAADVAASVLAAAQIDADVWADDAGGAFPSFQQALGVRLVVREEDLAAARDALAAAGYVVETPVPPVVAERPRPALQRWERVRRRGRLDYVLRYGVALWGVVIAVGFLALILIIDPSARNPSDLAVLAVLSFIIFPAAGAAWGLLTWATYEKMYRRWKKTPREEPGDSEGAP